MSALTDRLDEWAALAEKAAPGPWWAWGTVQDDVYVVRDADDEYLATLDYDERSYHAAEFMAESRTAVPMLVEALRAVLTLHTPYLPPHSKTTKCGYCSETGDPYCLPEGAERWPCPTVRVIADALGVDL